MTSYSPNSAAESYLKATEPDQPPTLARTLTPAAWAKLTSLGKPYWTEAIAGVN